MIDLNQPIRMPKLDRVTALAVATGLLGIATLYLLVRFGMALFTAHSVSAAEMQQRQLQLKAQDLQIAPMRGLGQKLQDSDDQASKFYQDRFPAEYSTIAAELGKLQRDTGVRQTRANYTPKAVGGGVTQISIEASLMGDYAPLMKFINGLERDKLFFVIRGVTLTGTQGGTVNLRLRMDTFLRPGSGADAALADAAAAKQADDKADSTQEAQ